MLECDNCLPRIPQSKVIYFSKVIITNFGRISKGSNAQQSGKAVVGELSYRIIGKSKGLEQSRHAIRDFRNAIIVKIQILCLGEHVVPKDCKPPHADIQLRNQRNKVFAELIQC